MKCKFTILVPDYVNFNELIDKKPINTSEVIVLDLHEIVRWFSSSDRLNNQIINGTVVTLQSGASIFLLIPFNKFTTLYSKSFNEIITDYCQKNLLK